MYTPGKSSVLMVFVGAVTPRGKVNKASALVENSNLNLQHTELYGRERNVTVRTISEIKTHNSNQAHLLQRVEQEHTFQTRCRVLVLRVKTYTHTHTHTPFDVSIF